MRRTLPVIATLCLGLSLARAGGTPPPPPKAEVPRGFSSHAQLMGADGKPAGTVTLEETPHGVLLNGELSGLPPGPHAFHIHETGKCEPPFKTAGGHFNPEGHKHGLKNPDGLHAGDLPNVEVGADGKARFQVFAPGVALRPGQKGALLDADGSSLVVHAKADDLASDPAGAAGDRIACGVVIAGDPAPRPVK